MPMQVTCTSCSGSFKVADSAAGKQAKCPKCGGMIDIPGGMAREEILDAEAAPPSFEDDASQGTLDAAADRTPCPMCGEMIQRSAVKCRYCGEVLDKSMAGILGGRAPDVRDPRWKKVRTGLATLYYSLILIVLTVVLMVVVGAVAGGMKSKVPGTDPPPAIMIMFGLTAFVILGAGIATLVGYVFCTNVPEVSGARGFAVGSIVCMLANVLFAMVGAATHLPAINLLGSLLSIVGWVLFILFIRRTADYLGNSQLTKSTTRFLIFCGALLAGAFVMGFIAGAGHAPALLGVVSLIVVVAGLIGFVWYVNLIQGLMKTIDQRIGS